MHEFLEVSSFPALALVADNASTPRVPGGGAAIVLAQAETTSHGADMTPGNDAKAPVSDGQVISTSKPATVDGIRGQNTDLMTPGGMTRDARAKSTPVVRDQTGTDKVILPGDMKRTVEDSSGKTMVTK